MDFWDGKIDGNQWKSPMFNEFDVEKDGNSTKYLDVDMIFPEDFPNKT